MSGVIPDVDDGLDAVSRDCLSRLGARYARCSTVAKDDAGYNALVRLAQPFRTRYPLVDGRGNFGSHDGDPPADARYTEARLAPIACELPRYPNLLVNGSDTIPAHNLGEVCTAVLAVAEDPSIDLDGIMRRLPGPDFATGGVVVESEGLRAAYATGSGSLRLRARAHCEDGNVVITELPYGIDKGGDDGVIREIAEGVGDGRLPSVTDIQDRSDRQGMRLVVTPRSGTDPDTLLTRLYAATSLEVQCAVELTARIEGTVRRFTLRELIDHFIAGQGTGSLVEIASRHADARRTSFV